MSRGDFAQEEEQNDKDTRTLGRGKVMRIEELQEHRGGVECCRVSEEKSNIPYIRQIILTWNLF
jgi:hypothetical protein